jgi:hypothetical protein
MKTIITLGLVTLFAGCAYSHIASTETTFEQPTKEGPLELHVGRHLDTVLKGPDLEEDQVLILKVRNIRLNQKLKVPSDNVTAEFSITRFGPSSAGEGYTGYVILRKITAEEVEAYLHLDLMARTGSGSYPQKEKFRGNYIFRRLGDANTPKS